VQGTYFLCCYWQRVDMTLSIKSCIIESISVWLLLLKILDDWRYIAMVIDRLQLCVFLAVTVGGTVGILCHAPHIFDYIDQEEIRNRLINSQDGVI